MFHDLAAFWMKTYADKVVLVNKELFYELF